MWRGAALCGRLRLLADRRSVGGKGRSGKRGSAWRRLRWENAETPGGVSVGRIEDSPGFVAVHALAALAALRRPAVAAFARSGGLRDVGRSEASPNRNAPLGVPTGS